MNFVGRHKEIKVLNEAYRDNKNHFFPLYGRRRIGKSELILHFIKDKPHLYFLGKKAPAQMQLKKFLKAASQSLQNPLFEDIETSGWHDALLKVTKNLKTTRKFIIVLDEFQWTAESSPDLPSILQEFIDSKWFTKKNIFLIICGSYLGFMEREILGEKSPLFGRRTGQMFLKPFKFYEAADFHPALSIIEKAQIYFICGGIPYYLNFMNQKLSLEQNIIQNLLNEYAALFQEPDFLLKEELKELEKYYGIMMAIANGFYYVKEMAAQTGINEKTIFYYLKQLQNLDYIEKKHPLSGVRNSVKTVKYIFKDNLLRFWFRFIYPNLDYIKENDITIVYNNLIKPYLAGYFGLCFEQLCREALPLIYKNERIISPYRAGEFWNKNIQIDIVSIREDQRIDIGECKWSHNISIKKISKELEGKKAHFPNPENKTINKRIFIKADKSRTKQEGFSIHSLKDLYSLGTKKK